MIARIVLLMLLVAVLCHPSEVSAQAADHVKVETAVVGFREPEVRAFWVTVVGHFAQGYLMGLALADPVGRGLPVADCFGTWSQNQIGEWLLQYWDRHPEVWSEPWIKAAITRMDRRMSESEDCKAGETGRRRGVEVGV